MAPLLETAADRLNEALADVGRNLVAEFKQLEEQEYPSLHEMYQEVAEIYEKLKVLLLNFSVFVLTHLSHGESKMYKKHGLNLKSSGIGTKKQWSA